jgi:hypothetical protein
MTKEIFTEFERTYLARFLGGQLPQPTTAFEARVVLEQAAAATNPDDADERLVCAALREWANEIDPAGAGASQKAH